MATVQARAALDQSAPIQALGDSDRQHASDACRQMRDLHKGQRQDRAQYAYPVRILGQIARRQQDHARHQRHTRRNLWHSRFGNGIGPACRPLDRPALLNGPDHPQPQGRQHKGRQGADPPVENQRCRRIRPPPRPQPGDDRGFDHTQPAGRLAEDAKRDRIHKDGKEQGDVRGRTCTQQDAKGRRGPAHLDHRRRSEASRQPDRRKGLAGR